MILICYNWLISILVITLAHERLQKRSSNKSPNSTTPDGGRSTSPESPFKLPPVQQQPSPSRIGAASVVDTNHSNFTNRPQVRVNPMYFQPDPPASEVVNNVGSNRASTNAHFSSTYSTCSTLSSKARLKLRVRFAPIFLCVKCP